ncbi:MAG: hypothetical protein HFJ55_00665 [Clostridia bacterium]|nr:hypothetical protein [Clostridia bacterium]
MDESMKIVKEKSGITLIALVVTIVVLIILAMISIAVLTGENGIIGRAKDSKNETTIAKEKEFIKLAYQTLEMEKRKNNEYVVITIEEMKDELSKYDAGVSIKPISKENIGDKEIVVDKSNAISYGEITFTDTKNKYVVALETDSDITPIVYTVTFNPNGGTGGPQTQNKLEGSSLIISTEAPTRTGYVFIGWSENQEATTVSYYGGDIYTKEQNITLYAVWQKEAELDKTKPVIEKVDRIILSKDTAKAEVKVTDTGSGVKGYYISTDETEPTATSPWINISSEEFTVEGLATGTTYYIWAIDNSGNISQKRKIEIEEINFSVDNSKYTTTLEQAITIAENNSIVKLLNNYTDTSTPTVDKNIVIDLQDLTLTRTGMTTIYVGKVVEITGTGKVTSSDLDTITNDGTLVISNSVTIENTSESYAAIKNNSSSSVVNINDNVHIKGSGRGVNNEEGTLNVNGGTIEGRTTAIYGNSSSKITIGRQEDALSTTSPILYGGVELFDTTDTFNFYNGIIISDTEETAYKGRVNARTGYMPYTYQDANRNNKYATILVPIVSDAKISITSVMKSYNISHNAPTNVYSVTGVYNGKTVYDNIVRVEANAAGRHQQTVQLGNIPVGTVITVNQIYLNQNYRADSETTIQKTVQDSTVQNFEFTYVFAE